MINDHFSNLMMRRQVYIERLKTAQSQEYAKVRSAVVRVVRQELNNLEVDNVDQLTKRQLTELVRKIEETHDQYYAEFALAFLAWLQTYSKNELNFTVRAFKDTLKSPVFVAPKPDKLWVRVKADYIHATGETILTELAALRKRSADVLKRVIRTSYITSKSVRDTMLGIIGTAVNKFKDGTMHGLDRTAVGVVNTIVQHAANVTRLGAMAAFKRYTKMYEWVSILDSKTSPTCRSLDGQRFEYGNGPIPPAHYNCRSHIEALFEDSVEFAQGKGTVREQGLSYYGWLKQQPVSFQDDVLGKTRGLLFRKGGINAKEFARLNLNRNFEPLTLQELEKKAPQIFQRAGVTI